MKEDHAVLLFPFLSAPVRLRAPARRSRVRLEARRRTALALGGLAGLFLLRVVGQLAVVLAQPAFLPPMELWYSGLISYPILLPLQLLILCFQALVIASLWRGAGIGMAKRPRVGLALCRFAYVYAAAMALRYVVTMAFFPEQRWLGGAIPVCFHQVLALWLFVFGRWLGREPASPAARGAA
jgi:hypothetical protein